MITIYTTSWCGFCKSAKKYLDSWNLKFEEKDVERDPDAAAAAFQKSGQMGVPVIQIDDQIVVGFDRRRLDEVLTDKKLI